MNEIRILKSDTYHEKSELQGCRNDPLDDLQSFLASTNVNKEDISDLMKNGLKTKKNGRERRRIKV